MNDLSLSPLSGIGTAQFPLIALLIIFEYFLFKVAAVYSYWLLALKVAIPYLRIIKIITLKTQSIEG